MAFSYSSRPFLISTTSRSPPPRRRARAPTLALALRALHRAVVTIRPYTCRAKRAHAHVPSPQCVPPSWGQCATRVGFETNAEVFTTRDSTKLNHAITVQRQSAAFASSRQPQPRPNGQENQVTISSGTVRCCAMTLSTQHGLWYRPTRSRSIIDLLFDSSVRPSGYCRAPTLRFAPT